MLQPCMDFDQSTNPSYVSLSQKKDELSGGFNGWTPILREWGLIISGGGREGKGGLSVKCHKWYAWHSLLYKLKHYGQLLHLGILAVMESIQYARISLWKSNLNGKPMDPHCASDGTWYMILFRLQTSLADSSFIDSSHCQGLSRSMAMGPSFPCKRIPGRSSTSTSSNPSFYAQSARGGNRQTFGWKDVERAYTPPKKAYMWKRIFLLETMSLMFHVKVWGVYED